ncbi:hypothetical protein LEN26_010332 [Aphanomyces euteiches]|nr:hypothetical protein LEN26_010332 [Aphanomyces euteiches]KAH9128047.1 hypothetical protein AeMF1_001743 [Aphanomyces euteiches]KAH9186618.1 hypothetical protein AeNC1_011402 [Aphanomyces euteiches]
MKRRQDLLFRSLVKNMKRWNASAGSRNFGRDFWAARKVCWTSEQLNEVVTTTAADVDKALSSSGPLQLGQLQRLNRAFLDCQCVEDQKALARRLHRAHPGIIQLLLRVVIEGEALSFVALHTMYHWSYSHDACRSMAALGVVETIIAILPLASVHVRASALDVLDRLTDQIPMAVCRLLRPRHFRVLFELLQFDDKSLPTLLRVLDRMVAHPKAIPLLQTRFASSSWCKSWGIT